MDGKYQITTEGPAPSPSPAFLARLERALLLGLLRDGILTQSQYEQCIQALKHDRDI
ncbi:hypothetical protein [Zongyangia hominis]|uniref:Uncharacterized protein n=1 Tax=Zongyangia hominis TaxID=2763677 RepID=A0A926EDP1_9FIRM|nr:hypothetical protein [Zongyangia hominis]MBC8570011.1 hypothetical protein [Zongyangia hominis]